MNKPIIALDFPSFREVEAFLNKFEGESLFVKVGMELYYQEGPDIVRYLKDHGHQVFLDLKLHDIPNTVESAMRGLAKLGIDLTNVHAAGGKAMMEAALNGLREGTPEGKTVPKLIAVTQLTSTTETAMHQEQLIPVKLIESVTHYAKLAQEAGLDGVVCSPLEADAVREATSEEFLRVTPGIRPSDAAVNDQKRITTPSMAKQIGSTHIVVGRPITRAENPIQAYLDILMEWNGETR
ncbi:MAG: orotidine 5'-phosphate decarboxylase [Firmicutes bacterium GWF2_51_9]|nr:orotidine-5'-phosphate decarboxylase [Erysipelotrichaceae bacterium]OGS54527.1 MAG: orotidine 5'-phosphate decarboxylase [Firmicutes bacterium GWF2_51_9]OGS57329.1 MAG: orotidine 5'-phosphate decarboxylase [Firmicutes bacterium GWE2_51_13]HAM62537.1 orotidine-5'-phosphate decarboxylase [Erysipelotrichaceae bacterium]HBZ41440.1 orotidine-5'-phosphate decarboxylase [Erysipelotrichaceae bacterium]